MNTKQKTNNQYAGKNGKLRSLFSLLVLFTLAFIGCNDPLTVTDNNVSAIPADKGSFSLRLSDAARTILPVTPVLNDFAVYNLSFTPVNSSTAVNVDRTNANLASQPVILEPGTYNLVVNAYKDNAKNQLAARGTSNGITITAGQNTSTAVTLEALLSGGTGTFRWNITIPSGVTASMKITPVNTGGTAEQTVTLTPPAASDSRALNSGQYSVTFNLTKADGKSVIWNELLYVYQNLESAFAFGFTDAHFSDTRYTVTYNYNDGVTSNQTQSVLHGAVLASNTPSRNGYNFGGWYTNSTFTNLYDFNSPVTGSFTLYAKWNTPPAYSNSVIEVTFTGSTRTVTLNNLNGNDIYLVKVNTSNLLVSDANTGGAQAPYPSLQNTGKSPLPSGKKLPRIGHPAADAFHANPPPIAAEAPRRQRALFAPPVAGETRLFWVEYPYGGAFVQKQATLRATGQYGNIWVMDENYGSGASANKIDNIQAQTLAQKFDQIYPVETKLIGYEYGGGPGGDGGKDGDPKVQILVYDIVDGDGDVMAAGYFWGKDYYNDTQLPSGQKSNLAEIFYIDASQLIDVPVYIHSALIHEFQHMINFNQKTVKSSVSSQTWYNEMLSMMAEDVIGPLIGITPEDSNHPIGTRIPTFLYTYDWYGVAEWPLLSLIGEDYATKFAFGAYLMRNYGGAELLQRILANNTANIDSIASALNGFESGLTFEKTLRRYGEAMIFSGSQMPAGVMTFDKTVTTTISGTTYTAYGFDIWDISHILSFSGTKGPKVLDLSPREMSMSPYSITVHSADGWKNKTGNYSITLNRPSDPNVILYLMVK
jgi:uncharacterized repeat protein (TIGR02543 family)